MQVEGEKAEINRMQELGMLTVHDTLCKVSHVRRALCDLATP